MPLVKLDLNMPSVMVYPNPPTKQLGTTSSTHLPPCGVPTFWETWRPSHDPSHPVLKLDLNMPSVMVYRDWNPFLDDGFRSEKTKEAETVAEKKRAT